MQDRYREIYADHGRVVLPRFNIAEACCTRCANDGAHSARFALGCKDEDGATARCPCQDLQ